MKKLLCAVLMVMVLLGLFAMPALAANITTTMDESTPFVVSFAKGHWGDAVSGVTDLTNRIDLTTTDTAKYTVEVTSSLLDAKVYYSQTDESGNGYLSSDSDAWIYLNAKDSLDYGTGVMTYTDTLTVTVKSGSSTVKTDNIPVTLTVCKPVMALFPQERVEATVAQGYTSQSVNVRIGYAANFKIGLEPDDSRTVGLDHKYKATTLALGDHPAEYYVNNPQALAQEEKATFQELSIKPGLTAGQHTLTAAFTYYDAQGVQQFVTVPVVITVKQAYDMILSAESLDLGTYDVGESAPASYPSIQVANMGAEAFDLTLTLEGEQAGSFQLAQTSLTLSAVAGTQFPLGVTPVTSNGVFAGAGAYEATLVITPEAKTGLAAVRVPIKYTVAEKVTSNVPAAIDWGSFIEGEIPETVEKRVALTNHTDADIELMLDHMHVSAYSTEGALLNGGGSPSVTLPANGELTLVLKPLANALAGGVEHDWQITYEGGSLTIPVKYKVIQRIWAVMADDDLDLSVLKGGIGQGTVDVGYAGNVDKTITVEPSQNLAIVSGASLNFEGSGREYDETPETAESTQTVTFKPADGLEVGTYNETLTLNWEEQGSPYDMTLNVTLRVVEKLTADVEEIDLGTFVAGEVTDANRKTVTLKNVTDQAQTLTFSGDVTVMNSAGAALTEQPLPAGASVQLKIGPADNAAAGEKSTSLIVTEKGGDKLLEIPVTYTVLPQAAKVNIPQHDPVEVIKGQETIFEQTIEYACNAPGTLTLTVGDSGGLTKLYLLNDAGTVVDKLEIPVEATHPGQAASNTWQMQTVTVRIKANDQLNANTLIGYMTAQLGTARKSGQVILLVGEAEYKLYLAPTHVNLGEFAAGQAIGDGVDVYLINKGTKAINYPTPQVTGPLTVTGIPTFGQMGPSAGTLVNIKPSDTQTPGQYAGSVTFVSSNNCQVTLTYEYTVLAQKAFTVTPAALDFGTIKQGAALPAYQTVTVTNTGMDTLAMTYQATAGYAISFSKTSLPKGESAQVTVQPNVNTLGIHTGTLTVSAEGLETQEAALTFTVEGAQALTAAPDTLDWGEMAVGEAAAEKEVRLTNNTGRTLELTVEASEGFDLDTDTVTLAPFASTAVKAVPDSQRIAGEKIGTLTIKDGSNVAGAVSLKYTGLPALRITPQVLDFGAILEGEAKPQGKMLSLESLAVGNIPCTITAQGGENWSYLPSFTVEKGLQTQISIQPQKNTAGVYDTELVITAGGVEHRVPVKYTVVKPTGIMTVKPETTLTLTQGYAAQKVVGLLTNTGEVALDVRYTGGGVLELSSFDGDLAPGQSAAPCVAIPEGLAPSTYKGTFTFTADNGDTGTWTVTVIVEPKAEQFPPTGDSSRLALWAALLAISGGCLLAMGKGKMKEN